MSALDRSHDPHKPQGDGRERLRPGQLTPSERRAREESERAGGGASPSSGKGSEGKGGDGKGGAKAGGKSGGDDGVKPESPHQAEQMAQRVPGGTAEKPTDIPKEGWLQIVKRGWAEAKTDNVPLLAAGVAFYGFVSIFPAIIASVLLYGLFLDPADLQRQVEALRGTIPDDALSIIEGQMRDLATSSNTGLGWGVVASVAVSLWSASNGAGNLITAVNLAYDEEETRGFVKRKALALGFTVGAIVFVVIAIALLGVLPVVFNALNLGGAARFGLNVVRWVLLIGAITSALALVYRWGPDRDDPKLKWTSVGAGAAVVLWLIVSVGFTLYTTFADYGSSAGSLAGVVVLLFWLWLTAYAILLGAEINAETEQQTVKDTTVGEEQPIGERDAYKADTLAGEPV